MRNSSSEVSAISPLERNIVGVFINHRRPAQRLGVGLEKVVHPVVSTIHAKWLPYGSAMGIVASKPNSFPVSFNYTYLPLYIAGCRGATGKLGAHRKPHLVGNSRPGNGSLSSGIGQSGNCAPKGYGGISICLVVIVIYERLLKSVVDSHSFLIDGVPPVGSRYGLRCDLSQIHIRPECCGYFCRRLIEE